MSHKNRKIVIKDIMTIKNNNKFILLNQPDLTTQLKTDNTMIGASGGKSRQFALNPLITQLQTDERIDSKANSVNSSNKPNLR